MVEFSSVWRRRHACERCRQLKVRCEYESPAATSCKRCTKNDVECVTRDVPRDPTNGEVEENESPNSEGVMTPDGDGHAAHKYASRPSAKPHGGALLQMLMGARKHIFELGPTPLMQAFTAGILTWEEANKMYGIFETSNSIIPLNLPPTLNQLDSELPELALAVISSVAIGTSTHNIQERLCIIQETFGHIFGNGNGSVTRKPLDSQLAMSVLTAYTCPYHERGLSRLFALHSITVGELRKLSRTKSTYERQQVLQAGIMSLIPYMLIEEFSPLVDLLPFYLSQAHRPYLGVAGSVLDAVDLAIKAIKTAEELPCALALAKQYDDTMATLDMLECHVASGTAKNDYIIDVFMMARVKIIRAFSVHAVSYYSIQQECVQELLTKVLDTGGIIGGKMARSFANRDGNSTILPTFCYFYMGEMLICLQALRMMAFTSGCDVDLKTDCLYSLINHKWMELANDNFVARQSMVSMFAATDMLQFKIGHLNPTTNEISGSGNCSTFDVFKSFAQSPPVHLGSFTRTDFQAYLDSIMKEKNAQKLLTANADSQMFTTTTPAQENSSMVQGEIKQEKGPELAPLSGLSVQQVMRLVVVEWAYV